MSVFCLSEERRAIEQYSYDLVPIDICVQISNWFREWKWYRDACFTLRRQISLRAEDGTPSSSSSRRTRFNATISYQKKIFLVLEILTQIKLRLPEFLYFLPWRRSHMYLFKINCSKTNKIQTLQSEHWKLPSPIFSSFSYFCIFWRVIFFFSFLNQADLFYNKIYSNQNKKLKINILVPR